MSEVYGDPRFELAGSGKFFQREGRLGRAGPFSRRKLCLVATDAAMLADLLYGLSLRPDCAFVKYSAVARDGMVLGRCFLETEERAAELCEALKRHPRLLVSLQDDEFFGRFREELPSDPATVRMWDAWPEEAEAVAAVHREAFGRPDEAALVERVRVAGEATISLVGVVDGEVVGHILLSPVTLDMAAPPRGLGLGPVAVRPSHQRRGIGAALVRAALRRARLLGYAHVVVLGHPSYYPRFGFLPASRFGLAFTSTVPDEAFMALPLYERGLAAVASASGPGAPVVVRYHPAFG